MYFSNSGRFIVLLSNAALLKELASRANETTT